MKYNKKTLHDINVENKAVIVRVDFNVPIASDGSVANDKRILESLPTIKYLLDKNAKIILLSHLGRVKTLDDLKKKSLKNVVEHLKKLLPNTEIEFEKDNTNSKLVDKIKKMPNRSIIVLENTRFNDVDSKGKIVKKESSNDSNLAKFWASLGEVFVNDAFGTSHRSHASNVGIASNIPESCIGFLIQKELEMLSKAIVNPQKPVVAIFGGKKITDKINSIESIAKIADKILIGGGMSYAFQKALGNEIGISYFEEGTEKIAKELLKKYKDKIVLPIDVHAGLEYSNDTELKVFDIKNFDSKYEGMDIGRKTIELFTSYLKGQQKGFFFKKYVGGAKTIIWNGPLGVCEFEKFSKGTNEICKVIAECTQRNGAFTLIGGGDSAAAAIKLGFEKEFSHISTGGGASIEYLEGKDLPGIVAIQNVGDEIKIIVNKTPSKSTSKKINDKPIKKSTTTKKEKSTIKTKNNTKKSSAKSSGKTSITKKKK